MIHVLLQFEELSNFDVLPPIGVWKARTIQPVLCHSQTVKLLTYRFTAIHLSAVDSLSFMFVRFFPACIRSLCSSSLGNMHWMYLYDKRSVDAMSAQINKILHFFFFHSLDWSALHGLKSPSVRENSARIKYHILYLVAYHSKNFK